MDFLGFSRPEMSVFNGLRAIFAENNFRAALTLGRDGAARVWRAERQGRSWDELSVISDFLQSNVGSYSDACWYAQFLNRGGVGGS